MKTINEIKDYLTELFNDKKGLNLRLFSELVILKKESIT